MQRRYRIPYYYDEVDESYPVKYLNDMLPPVSFSSVGMQNSVNGIPIDAIWDVTATEAQHAEIEAHDDVEVVN